MNKFAVGYRFDLPDSFSNAIKPYLDNLSEVYFPYPGIGNARAIAGDPERLKPQLYADLNFCRRQKLKLDLVLNAGCYGDQAISYDYLQEILAALNDLAAHGIMPSIVTTTSFFVAEMLRRYHPELELRASVNLRLKTIPGMTYLADYFDSFYIDRDIQRDLPTVKLFADWAHRHGKKLGILVNSGCLRNCPYGIFHENLAAHNTLKIWQDAAKMQFSPHLCIKRYNAKHYVDFLRGSWIRPQDVSYFEPHFDIVKLSTREGNPRHFDRILRSYCQQKPVENLLELTDPTFDLNFSPYYIDTKAFPANWATGGVAGLCANNCTECGKCDAVLKQVLKRSFGYATNWGADL